MFNIQQVHPNQPSDDSDGKVATIQVNIKSKFQISPFLYFKDKHEREQFVQSFQQETACIPIAAMLCFAICLVIIESVRMVTIQDQEGSPRDNSAIIVLCSFCALLCAVVCYIKLTENFSAQAVQKMEEVSAILITICTCIALLVRSWSSCTLIIRGVQHRSQCLGHQELQMLPAETLIAVAMVAVFIDCSMPSLRWSVVVGSWMMCSITMLSTFGFFKVRNSGVSVALSIGASFFCIFMKRYNRLHAFRKIHLSVEQKNQSLRKDFEKARQETVISDATEWRHIVSNVAHDLKTPVAAMSAGCDFVLSLLSDVTKIATRYNVFAHLQSDLSSLSSTAESMQHTCAFMTMMVHRYVDYTKTSHGLALVPHLEMVRLLDTIVQGPVACVKDVMALNSSNLSVGTSKKGGSTSSGLINVVPVPPEVRTVVTDKRWLEENVLCLLSNAVKYSGNQPVDLRVELVEVEGAASASGEEAVSEASVRRQLVKISVSDSGVGIPPEERESLFQAPDPSSRSSGGTGLGLYVLAHRVSALGGSCGVADRIDGSPGSVVWFSFPFTRSATDGMAGLDLFAWDLGSRSFSVDHEPSRLSPKAALYSVLSQDTQIVSGHESFMSKDTACDIYGGPSRTVSMDSAWHGSMQRITSPTSSMFVPKADYVVSSLPRRPSNPPLSASNRIRRVLIVDDSVIILKMVGNLLRRAGYVVETAENGREAVDKVRRRATADPSAPLFERIESAKLGGIGHMSMKTIISAGSDERSSSSKSQMCSLPVDVSDKSFSPIGAQGKYTEVVEASPDGRPQMYYDAILMDLQMPIMDGFEACRHIRQMEVELAPPLSPLGAAPIRRQSSGELSMHHTHTAHEHEEAHFKSIWGLRLPFVDEGPAGATSPRGRSGPPSQLIIGCSANSDSVTIQQAYAAGVDAFLPKPFALSAFQAIVSSHMGEDV